MRSKVEEAFDPVGGLVDFRTGRARIDAVAEQTRIRVCGLHGDFGPQRVAAFDAYPANSG